MGNLDKAIERIKNLECPTGEVENRVADILEDYDVADRDLITINKETEEDENDLEVYSAFISGSQEHLITVLAKSGIEDYVAKVVDVYVD